MHCLQNTDRAVSPLVVNNLCAQLAPLNRYGLPGLGAAVAKGLRVLVGMSRAAVGALVRSEER